VCSSGSTGGSDGDEQFRVCVSDTDVVSDDRQTADDVVEELAAGALPFAGGDPDPDAQFRNRDGSDRGFVVVSDQCVEVELCSLRFDQDVGVQEEQGQNRSSVLSWSRSAATSPLQSVSTRCRRSTAFAAAPFVAAAGSS
jgi:hypothetical protein